MAKPGWKDTASHTWLCWGWLLSLILSIVLLWPSLMDWRTITGLFVFYFSCWLFKTDDEWNKLSNREVARELQENANESD